MSHELLFNGVMRYALMPTNPAIVRRNFTQFWLKEGDKPDLTVRQDCGEDGGRIDSLLAHTPEGEAHLKLLERAYKVYARLCDLLPKGEVKIGSGVVIPFPSLKQVFWQHFLNPEINWDNWMASVDGKETDKR